MTCGYTPVNRIRSSGKIVCDSCRIRRVRCCGIKTTKRPDGGPWPLWERRPGHTSAAVDRLTQAQNEVLNEMVAQTNVMRSQAGMMKTLLAVGKTQAIALERMAAAMEKMSEAYVAAHPPATSEETMDTTQ